MSITVDQLLAEWRKCEQPPESVGMTTKEVAEALNLSEVIAREMLKTGVEQGKIENLQELRVNPFRGGRKYWANVWRVKNGAEG